MRRLILVLAVCAAAAVPFAQADDQPNLAAIRAACADDAQKFCAGVPPGGGRIVACLKEHRDSLSDRCKKAAGVASNTNSSSAPATSGASTASQTPTGGGASTPAAKSSTVAGTTTKASSSPGSYLRMKQVQIIAHVDDPSLGGKADLPALDMLIPSTWSFKGAVAANTKEGCYSDFHATSWEATSSDGTTAFKGAPTVGNMPTTRLR